MLTLTCPARTALSDDEWARSAPAPRKALLAVPIVHVAPIGEHLHNKGHKTITACI